MRRVLAYLVIVVCAAWAGFVALWMPGEGLEDINE